MNDEIRKNGKPVPGDVRDEVAFHLEERTRELIDQGMDPAAARTEARRRFGDVREITHAAQREDEAARMRDRRTEFLREFLQDLRVGFRRLLQAPGFAILGILIIALGIGANSAIFSVLNAVVLQPLDYPEPDRLVQVWESSPSRGWEFFSASELNYRDFRDDNDTFEHLAAVGYGDFNAGDFNIRFGDEVVRLNGRSVSIEFFDTFAMVPFLGRAFTPEEDEVGNESRVVLLGERFWRERFDADADLVGSTVLLNDEPYTVVGVLPEGRFYFDEAHVYTPMRAGRNESRSDHRLNVFGRLKPGVTVEQAEADLDNIAARLQVEYPEHNEGWDTVAMSLYDSLVPSELRTAMYVLIGAVGMVLLIACANLSSLLLARATGRQREVAIYAALGASRGRILRQMLTETTLLAIIGGAIGTAIAVRGVEWFRALDPARLPRFDDLAIDGTVLLFALGATLATALLAGVLPAWQASGADPQEALKEGGRGTAGNVRTRRARQALLVAEVALSIVLLAGAGLLIRSFLQVQSVDPGIETDPVLTLGVNMPFSTQEEFEQLPAQFRAMLESVETLPGVEGAATISGLPFGGGATSMDIQVDGVDHGGNYPSAFWRLASPRYFEVMGIPLIKGRGFRDLEEDPQRVAIISQNMAESLWPDQDPIGKTFFGWRDPERGKRVIGVVGDVRERSLESEAQNLVYMPHLQMTWWSSMYFVVRTDGDPAQLAASVRAAIQQVVPDRPVTDIRPLRDVLADTLGPRRFNTSLLLCFAAVALLLAAAGVYGVMAYSVAQRTSEIGVRMAMGARASDVVAMVLRQGMSVVGVGIGIGLAASLAATRLLASLLFGVEPFDPASLTAAVLFLGLIALVACIVPAVRATRIHPTEALRDG